MFEIPREVVDILKLINSQNYEAFLIGGAVRDILNSQIPKDYDICTNMPLEELKKVLPNFHLMKKTNIRNAGIIIINNISIEISMYKGKNLKEDILKRDFTINGIALSHIEGLIDYYNFRTDIEKKKIRLIDNTSNSIKENPIIILRAIRLSEQLNFEIDSNTLAMLKENKDLLKDVKQERVYKELQNILNLEGFVNVYTKYIDIFETIMPEISNISKKNKIKLQKLLMLLPTNPALRIAALLLYTENNIEKAKELSNRLHMDKKTIKSIIYILKYANIQLGTSKKDILQLIHEINIQNVELLFVFKYILLYIDNKDLTQLSDIQSLYQKEVDEIRHSRLSKITLNTNKIEEMGYSSAQAILIYNSITGKIINKELPSNDKCIEQFILKHYKRS